MGGDLIWVLWLVPPPPPGATRRVTPRVTPRSRPEAPLGSASSLPALEAERWMAVPALLHGLLKSPSAECRTEKG